MPRRGLTAEAVLDAASDLADADGFEAVTLAALASALGIRSPSLYRHVDGLAGVQNGLIVRGLDEARARVEAAVAGKERDAALFALAHAYWDFARERPGLYAASLSAPGSRNAAVGAASERLMGAVLAVLAGYGARDDDALHAMRGLRAIVHGFVSLDAAGGFQMKLDLSESFDRLLTAFADDLRRRCQRI